MIFSRTHKRLDKGSAISGQISCFVKLAEIRRVKSWFDCTHRRVSENEIFFFKIKEGENYNHRNTLKYFEDYNLSLT